MKVDETACRACGITGNWMERAPTPGTAHGQGASLGLTLSYLKRGTVWWRAGYFHEKKYKVRVTKN